MIADARLAALCLAGGLAVALAAMLVGLRMRRTMLLIRPWLLAIWIILTIGLTAAAYRGLATPGSRGWSLAAGWLVASTFLHLVDRSRTRAKHTSRRWGASLVHLGVAVAAGGMILSSTFAMASQQAMQPGDTVKFGAWTIQLHEVWPAADEGWVGVAAELRASSGDGVLILEPQQRTRFDGTPRAEPATVSNWSGMLTANLGLRGGDGRWPIRLTWTPLLALIGLGGAIAALGGAVAMIGPPIARWRRMRRARLATAWWA